MFEALFGPEMPFAIRFSLAFLISFGLIGAAVGAATWAVRRFRTGRLGGASARARDPRLAVITSTNVDESRQLILVRRDNVEHLLMIGWRTNVIVEANIVRAGSAPHEVVAARSPAAVEPPRRGVPLPDKGSWPPQLEPTGAERPASQTESLLVEPAASPLQPATAQPTATEATSAADETLAALVHRLEIALRAAAAGRRSSAPPRSAPALEWIPAAEAPPAPSFGSARSAPERVETAPADAELNPSKTLYDSLEKMAILLGRPTKH